MSANLEWYWTHMQNKHGYLICIYRAIISLDQLTSDG